MNPQIFCEKNLHADVESFFREI
jgi:hypothetical protein